MRIIIVGLQKIMGWQKRSCICSGALVILSASADHRRIVIVERSSGYPEYLEKLEKSSEHSSWTVSRVSAF